MSLDFVPELADTIKKMLPSLQITKRTKKLTLTGSTPIKGNVLQDILGAMTADNRKTLADKFGATAIDPYNATLCKSVEDALLKAYRPEINLKALRLNDSIDCPMSHLRLIENVKNLKHSFFYDPLHDRAYQYDRLYIDNQLQRVLGDALPDWMSTNMDHCRVSYVPHCKKRVFRDEQDGHLVFNVWQEPEWMKEWYPAPDAICPPIVDEYLRHLIADEESIKYVKCWLRDAIFGKAWPILVLHGSPGTGKTFLISSFLAAFFNPDDYHMSPSTDFGSDKFQSELSECQILHGEEVNIDENGKEFLKKLHNGRIAINRKFQNVGATEQIWANIAITMNPKSRTKRVKLEYGDRKFFVPNLNKKPLKITWGLDNVNKLAERLKRIDFIQQVASYLYHFSAQGDSESFPKTEQFKEMCIDSYGYVFRRFIATCRTSPEVTSRDFKKNFHRFIDMSTLEADIQSYHDNFGEPLAELVHKEHGSWIAYSKVYVPDKAYTNGSGAHTASNQGLEEELPA